MSEQGVLERGAQKYRPKKLVKMGFSLKKMCKCSRIAEGKNIIHKGGLKQTFYCNECIEKYNLVDHMLAPGATPYAVLV